VGRAPDNDLVIEHHQISALHAFVHHHGGRLFVEDRGSRNGTLVRGVRIAGGQRVEVARGESVELGPVRLCVEPAERATLAGRAGLFSLAGDAEVLAGRDGEVCSILLPDPSVSAVHARLKLVRGRVLVRDERSKHGTKVAGVSAVPGVWVAASHGDSIELGPVDLRVSISAVVGA
jgi:pSer/pThr/pTyr-binding forkhead associated (FHA) protein